LARSQKNPHKEESLGWQVQDFYRLYVLPVVQSRVRALKRRVVVYQYLLLVCMLLLMTFVEMTAGQLHETLKQRILQLTDQDQLEILANIEVKYYQSHVSLSLNFS